MARIGIIGTGWGARTQVPVFRESGLDVVAIAGHSREKTENTAAALGLKPITDWRDLIELDLDLVSIVTPPSEHLEMARAALDAGKHVICEKPTASHANEAESLVVAARSNAGQIAIIDHELRFLPSWLEARRRVPDLGVRYFEIRYASPARGERLREWTWWSDAASGGGIWGAVGSHFVDAIRYLAGGIDSVQALLSTIIRERPAASEEKGQPRHLRKVTSDDFSVVNLRLRNGVLATMSCSVVASGPDEPAMITIHGENGALRLVGEELLFASRGVPFERIAGNEQAKRPGNSSGGAFGSGTYYLGAALKSALDDDNPEALAPAATFEDGLEQQRVLDAARRSNANGGHWEDLPR